MMRSWRTVRSLANALSLSLAGACLAGPAFATTPEDRAARILTELDASGPFIISTEGDQLNIAIWWTGTAFVVTREGTLVPDATTQIDENGRLVFAGGFSSPGTPTVQGMIDYPDDAPWLVFDLSAAAADPVHVAPDLPNAWCSMKKCKCGGTGGTVAKACEKQDCEDNSSCRKKDEAWVGYCTWYYGQTPCTNTPLTPIPVDQIEEQ